MFPSTMISNLILSIGKLSFVIHDNEIGRNRFFQSGKPTRCAITQSKLLHKIMLIYRYLRQHCLLQCRSEIFALLPQTIAHDRSARRLNHRK